MKRSVLTLLAAIALIFTACQKNGGELQFKTVTFSDSIAHEGIVYTFDAEMELPSEGATAEVRESLRDNIVLLCLGENYVGISDRKLLNVYSDSSYAEYARLFESDMASIDPNIDFVINCETRIRGAVSYESDRLLNYEHRMYVYSGGAHGMYRITNYIFDVNTGEVISEADIFADNVDDRLHALLVEQATTLRSDGTLPSDSDFFGDDLIIPNGNLELGENGLSYIFNPYEIAPYSYGTIAIPLDNDKVLPLLNPQCPIYRYISSKTAQ